MLRLARVLFSLSFAMVAIGPAEGSSSQEEPPPPGQDQASQDPEPLTPPATAEQALDMHEGLAGQLEQRDLGELQGLLEAWVPLLEAQKRSLDEARAAPAGSPAHLSADQLSTDLDVLVAGAETILDAITSAGGDVERVRTRIESLRRATEESVDASTVPQSLEAALELEVEVLKAQLRPLRRDQVEEQLGQWLDFLQKTCTAVRNVEVAALRAEDAAAVKANTERAVKLRGDRGRLIERVQAVIAALEKKGGDVEEAKAYVGSVVVTPPITGLRAAWSTAMAWATDSEGGYAAGLRILKAIGIILAFWVLSWALGKLVARATRSLRRASELLRAFITKMVQRITLFIGVLIALSTMGINMTPLLAAIGAAGLVIGLALQGTLGNLASGMMIMVYRPFDVGDVIKTAGVIGKVEGMTLMTTAIKTFDNQTIYVPNNSIWGDVITNVTAKETRRVDLVFGISYGDDFARAKRVLKEIVTSHEKVLTDPEPVIRLHELGDSSVNLVVRPWTRTADYWDVYWDLTEAVKKTFDEQGISIPFPQRDVHLIPADGKTDVHLIPAGGATEAPEPEFEPQSR